MMYWYDNGHMSGWGWGLMTIGMIVFWGVLIAVGVALFRYLSRGSQERSGQQPSNPNPSGQQQPPTSPSPEAILAERFARGEIDEDEYHTRLAALRGAIHS